MEQAVSKRLARRAQIALSRRVSDWASFGLRRIDAFARLCDTAGVCVHVFCDMSSPSQRFRTCRIHGTRAVGLACDNDFRLRLIQAVPAGFERGPFMSAEIKPYRISVGDDVLGDLKSRLRNRRWLEAELVKDWSQGAPLKWIQDIPAKKSLLRSSSDRKIQRVCAD